MQPVAILGVGRTDYAPKPDIAIPEMVHQAVQVALTDAGLSIAQIDAVVTASVDLYDGLTASNLAVTEVVGAVMKPEARIAGDGLLAACHAAMTILAGAYATVLVVAHCKVTMGDRWAISNWTFDPIYLQPLGLDDYSAAALQRAVLGSPAPLLPASHSDGAAAIVLSACSHPQSFDCAQDKSAIRHPQLMGMGWALDEHYLGDRDLSDSPALRAAAHRAYNLAGISNPERDLSFVALSDPFGYQRELWASALGIGALANTAQQGHIPGWNEHGRQTTDRRQPSAVSTAPPFVAGLDCLIEVVNRLRQEPGMGLAHGCWGPAGQGQAVTVVRR